jgi:hypothetical protein
MKREIAAILVSLLLILSGIFLFNDLSDFASNAKGATIIVNETGSG